MSLLWRQDTAGYLQGSVLQSLGCSAEKGENQDDNNCKQSLLMMPSFSPL